MYMGRCVMDKRAGGRCKCRAIMLIGGLAVCQWHQVAASKLYEKVQDSIPGDVHVAALRDTTECNQSVAGLPANHSRAGYSGRQKRAR